MRTVKQPKIFLLGQRVKNWQRKQVYVGKASFSIGFCVKFSLFPLIKSLGRSKSNNKRALGQC